MKMPKKPRTMGKGHGKHSPFCKWTYEWTSNSEGWFCKCRLIDIYEKWLALPPRYRK